MANTETDQLVSPTGQNEDLKRTITAPLLFFYVLGDVLGSGIYALIGVMALEVGGAFWTSFVVGVTVAMLTGFAYAELITKYPQAAGAALYVSKAFGNRFFTFVVTYFMLSASIAAAGALALVFGGGYFNWTRYAGLVTNLGLLVNTVLDDPGAVGYAAIMVAVGLVLYVVNNLVTSKTDRQPVAR